MAERERRSAKAAKATEKAVKEAAKLHAAALKAEASAAKVAAKADKALVAAAAKTTASEVKLAAASNRAQCTSRRCNTAFVPEGATVKRYTSKQCSRYCAPGSTNALCAACHGQVNNPKLWHGKVTNSGLPPYSHMRLEGIPHSNWNIATAAKEAKAGKASSIGRVASNGVASNSVANPAPAPAPGVPTFHFE